MDNVANGPERLPMPGALSSQEMTVVQLTAEGFSSREIATKLNISAKSVYTYRMRAMAKLNLTNRRDLVHFAVRWGLVHPEE